MAKPKNAPSTFLIANIILAMLIGVILWFLLLKGQDQLNQTNVAPLSLQGLSEKDRKEIADLQTQLELEKARAEQSREKLRARKLEHALLAEKERTKKTDTEQASAPLQATLALSNELESEKARIKEMIIAQMKGATENKRLAQALENKNQQLAAVTQQKNALEQRFKSLNSDTQTLLNSLASESIQASDQDYLQALQGDVSAFLTDESRAALASAKAGDVDLLNQIEISDTNDTSLPTANLRAQVGALMTQEQRANQQKSQLNVLVSTPIPTPSNASLQDRIDALISSNAEREAAQAAEVQFNKDNQYLSSLNVIEKERENETRWVTVREGDTLWIIAKRAYDDGWLYPKIFAANPQILSNPDRISTGQRLRVPL